MKVGFVLDDSLDKTDGVQQYVLTLGKWLEQEGHSVHYLVGQTERADLARIHSLSRNVQVHFNQNRMSTPLPASKQKVKELLRAERFDVLHVQLPCSPFMAGRVVKYAPASTAVIGTFHIVPASWLEAFATRALRLALWRVLKRFDDIFSVSLPAQQFARRSMGLKTQIIPNAVDGSFYRAGKKIPSYQDGKTNIVFVGRLVERKGCMHLLRSIAYLNDQRQLQNVRVVICGKGPLDSRLKAYVKKHNLSEIVSFTGYVSEVQKTNYFASAHIAVFPSVGGESFGIVLIEAMAAGSEVVLGGNNKGYKSVLKAWPNQLFDPTDTTSFADTLWHFIGDHQVRAKIKKQQLKMVQQYDVRFVGPQIIKAYEQAIAKRSETSHNGQK